MQSWGTWSEVQSCERECGGHWSSTGGVGIGRVQAVGSAPLLLCFGIATAGPVHPYTMILSNGRNPPKTKFWKIQFDARALEKNWITFL